MRWSPAWLLALTISALPALADSAGAGLEQDWRRTAPSIWSWDYYARLFARAPFGKSFALVVGVGNYDRLPRLSAPANDAIRMRDFLRDEAGFDRIITLTDEEATLNRILQLMDEILPATVNGEDRFLFYFSGHGITRDDLGRSNKRGYLALKGSTEKGWSGMIDMPRVMQWAQNVAHARHSLFVLDACFSGLAASEIKGSVGERTIARLLQPGQHIITAGTEGQRSFIYGERSLFTDAFLAAARGDGMIATDGVVSLSEMMTRINRIIDARQAELNDKIDMTPHQYYTRVFENNGEFFFLPRPSASPRPSSPTPGVVVPKGPDEQASLTPGQMRPPDDPPRSPTAPDATAPTTPRTSISPTPPATIRSFTMQRGVEASGVQAGPSAFVNSTDQCAQSCSRTAGCEVFTFGTSTRACYLYSRAELSANIAFETGVRDPAAATARAPLRSASTAPVPQTSSRAAFAIRRNVEAAGTTAGPSRFVASIGHCQQACVETSGCEVFTYNAGSQACYLYSRAEVVANDAFTTGVRDPAAIVVSARERFTIQEGMEASGREARPSVFTSSAEPCRRMCIDDASCRAYSYNSTTNACYFYADARLSGNRYFETGVRR